MLMGVLRLAYFNIESQAELSKRLQVSRLVADNGPKLAIDVVASHNDVDWSIASIFVQANIVEVSSSTMLEVKVFEWAPSTASPLYPTILLQANAIVPMPLLGKDPHQVGVDKVPVS